MGRFDFDFRDDALRGRVILVAGGSGGLGSASVALLARDGADVVVGFRDNSKRAEQLQAAVWREFGRKIHLVGGDISDPAVRERYLSAAAQVGSLYGFVCFTGDPGRVSLEDATEELLMDSFRANYTAPLLLARDAVADMKNAVVSGCVVLVSSMQALSPFAGSVNYAGPKIALTHAARIMAKQWGGPGGIRVNVVAPGVNRAGMALTSIQSGKYDSFVDSGKIPRFGLPEDIARVVRLLVHPDNYITGQVIAVDGGFTLHV